MRRLKLTPEFADVRLTTSQAAPILGMTRRTLANHIGSGLITSLMASSSGQDPTERRPWAKIPLETVYAYREYLGGPGDGRPWGAKRHIDQIPGHFGDWLGERKAEGWHLVSWEGEFVFGP